MTQTPVILPGSPLAGSAMVGDINSSFASVISKFSGTVAPTLGPGSSSALVEGQEWLNSSVTPHQVNVYDGAQFIPAGYIDTAGHTYTAVTGPTSWRNILADNGGLEVWQRGAGSSASISVGASSTAYTADRWYLTTGANEASTVAAVAGLTNGSQNAGKVTRNSGQTGTTVMTFGFPLDTDEVARMRGQKVVVQAAFKTGANWSPTSGTFNLDFYVGTGSAGKRGAGFTGETHVATASASPSISTQGTIVSVVSSVVVPANATQGEVQFTWLPLGTAGADDSITFDDVQLEAQLYASAFERTPFDVMLQKCKRHFWKTFLYGTAPAQNAGVGTGEVYAVASNAGTSTVNRIHTRFPVSMRASPVVTSYNPANTNAQVRDEVAAADTSAISPSNTAENWQAGFTGNASTAVGNLVGVHLSADAGL